MIEQIIEEHIRLCKYVSSIECGLKLSGNSIVNGLKQGGTIFIAGNGGSASDAQHFAAELVGRFKKERKPLRAVCLNTDTSAITAIANDYGYENVFSRQLEGLATKNDVFVGFTTSGKSKNILNAFDWCFKNEIPVLCFCGQNIPEGVKFGFSIPSTNTARIQEMHILIIHILCQLIDDAY